MKKYPVGTTKEQWDRYQRELVKYDERRQLIRPIRENFKDEGSFKAALGKWSLEYMMDKPNRPGSQFSNND